MNYCSFNQIANIKDRDVNSEEPHKCHRVSNIKWLITREAQSVDGKGICCLTEPASRWGRGASSPCCHPSLWASASQCLNGSNRCTWTLGCRRRICLCVRSLRPSSRCRWRNRCCGIVSHAVRRCRLGRHPWLLCHSQHRTCEEWCAVWWIPCRSSDPRRGLSAAARWWTAADPRRDVQNRWPYRPPAASGPARGGKKCCLWGLFSPQHSGIPRYEQSVSLA